MTLTNKQNKQTNNIKVHIFQVKLDTIVQNVRFANNQFALKNFNFDKTV